MKSAEAKLTVRLGDPKVAAAALKALEPDNKQAPADLRIRGAQRGGDVTFRISAEDTPARLLSTLDDLIVCLQVAERSLKKVPA